jgi:hypothetical protein
MAARDRGRLQRLARELLALGCPVSTADLCQAAHPERARFSKRDYEQARRVLRLYADPIGRARGSARPWLWRKC